MERSRFTGIAAGLVGFVAFVGVGWAAGSATKPERSVRRVEAPARITTSPSADGARAVPLVSLEQTADGRPATLTYEAPAGATPPAAAPATPPAPAPRRPVAATSGGQVDLPTDDVGGVPTDSGARRTWADTDGSATPTAAGPAGPISTAATGPAASAEPSATTTATGTVGPLPEPDDPGIIDLCAGDDPIEGCPAGVGATVQLAFEHFEILRAEAITGPSCAPATLDRNRFVVTLTSNAPAAYTIEQRSQQSGTTTHHAATTPGAEIWRWAADGMDSEVTTCVVLPAAAGDESFVLDLHAVPWDDLESAGDDLRVEVRPALGDRAPVIMRPIDDTSAMLLVGSKPEEKVDAVLVRRPADRETSACELLEDDGSAPGSLEVETLRELRGGFFVGSPFAGTAFSDAHVYELRLRGSDLYDLCLTWSRDLAPRTTVTQRESFSVQPPAHVRVRMEFTAVDLERGAGAGSVHADDMTGFGAWLVDRDGGERCHSWIEVPLTETALFCDLPTTAGAVSTVRVHLQPRFVDGGDDPVGQAFDGGLELQSGLCSGTTCGGTATLPLSGPDGRFVAGRARLRVTYTNPPLRASGSGWDWRNSGTFGDGPDAAAEDQPQLDLSETEVNYSSADPFHLTVRWKADRPVTGRVVVRTQSSDAPACRSDREPGAVPTTGNRPTGDSSGRATFEVCPGTRYAIGIRLESTDEHRTTWLLGGGMAVPDTEIAAAESAYWPGGAFETPRLAVRVTFATKLRLGTWTGYQRVAPVDSGQPSQSHVDWWVDVMDHPFSQSRRSGFIVQNSPTCGPLGAFDLAPGVLQPEPLRLEVGPRVLVRVDATYATYSACRAFTSAAASDPTMTGGAVLIDSIPVADLVRNGRASVTDQGPVPYTRERRPAPSCSWCVPWLTLELHGGRAP